MIIIMNSINIFSNPLLKTNLVKPFQINPTIDMNNYPNVLTPPLDSPDYIMSSSPSDTNISSGTITCHKVVPPFGFTNTRPLYLEDAGNPAPHLVIIEQPMDKFRFRYKSEMAGTHGSLNGKTSDRTRKQTFPCVKLANYNETAIVRCTLYQWGREDVIHMRQPHAHRLVKKHGSEETDDPHDIEVNVEIGYYANFHSMGIIHTAKKYIVPELVRKNTKLKLEEVARTENKIRSLNRKEELEVKMIAENESKYINLNIVCLRFDAYKKVNGILHPLCPPIYSNAINNLKSALTGDLKIVRMDHCASPSHGGREIFILVEKVAKKNIKIRLFELDDEDNEIWSDYGRFTDLDVHHQYAIVFKTPPYKRTDIDKQVKVFIELLRPSDGARSEPKDFTYTPCEIPPGKKRARCNYSSCSSTYFSSDELPTIIPQIINKTNFTDFGDQNVVVNSSELDEALKQNNINSAEFKKLWDSLGLDIKSLYGGTELQIDSEEMQKILETDGTCSVKQESRVQHDMSSKRILLKEKSKSTRLYTAENKLNQSDSQIITRVKNELTSFFSVVKNPSKQKIVMMLESLLQSREYISQDGNTALHLGILENNPKNILVLLLLRVLLKYQLTQFVNIQNKQGQTPLHLAVEAANYSIVEHLMNTKANVSIQDIDGNTPLHIAIMKNVPTLILRSLLSVGSDAHKFINLENYDGLAALHLAVKTNNIGAIKLLCWRDANVNIEHKKNGYTPLHMAVADQHLEIVNFLLDSTDVVPDAEDYMQSSPLKLAKVLIQSDKPVTQEIYNSIENRLKKIGLFNEVIIKEELDDISEEEIDDIKMEIVEEDSSTSNNLVLDEMGEKYLDQVCNILDNSGSWRNLVELLDHDHLLRTTNVFTSMEKPSKSILNFALANGNSLQQIRDCLESLNESEAAEIIDNMIQKDYDN